MPSPNGAVSPHVLCIRRIRDVYPSTASDSRLDPLEAGPPKMTRHRSRVHDDHERFSCWKPAVLLCLVGALFASVGSLTMPAFASSSSPWVIAHVPQPAGGGGFDGVSCPTVTTCVAVGYQNAGPGTEPAGTLAEAWNGNDSRIQPTPNPAGFDSGEFNDVSCTSATFCMAVGFAFSSPDTYRTLAETWNGAAWSIQATPTPGTGGHLDGVSCTSPTNCIAGGLSGLGQLAEQWNGSAWTVMPLTELSHADLSGISCTQATSCMAVGFQWVTIAGSSYSRVLAEHWDGST
jgi:hypothetical protein